MSSEQARVWWTVIYRRGGTARFEWLRVYRSATNPKASNLTEATEELGRMGYAAKVVRLESVHTALGGKLPTDWEGTV